MPFFGKIGWLEVVLIVGIVLIIFGPSKLPGLSRSIGQAIKNYRDGVSGKSSPEEEKEAGKEEIDK